MSRRTLLHRASAAVGAGALAGLAGCSSLRGGIDGSPKVPSWATYSPNPDRVFADRSSGDAAAEASRRYPIRARRLSDLAAYYDDRGEGFPDAALYQEGTSAHPVVDLPPSKAYLEVRAGGRGLSVVETALLEDRIVEAFRTPEEGEPVREPFEETGEYEGYRILERPDGGWAVAVNGGAVFEAFESSVPGVDVDERAAVEAIVDARSGTGRYVAGHDAVGEVARRLGTGLTAAVDGVRDPETAADEGEPVATGVAYTAAEADNARRVLVFASADDAAAHEVDRDAPPVADWREVETATDGRAVTVTGTGRVA